MRKTRPAEWLLARLTTLDRAAAILGDLTEMAAIRGSLWFWTAYVCAVISLGWRTGGSAFLLALICRKFVFGPILLLLMYHPIGHMHAAGFPGVSNQIKIITWNAMFVIAQCLMFALPFAVVRFGWRDRLTQLVCVFSLIATAAYSLIPWFMDISGVLTALTVVAALLLPLWRRPLIILAATCFTATAFAVAWLATLVFGLHRSFSAVAILTATRLRRRRVRPSGHGLRVPAPSAPS